MNTRLLLTCGMCCKTTLDMSSYVFLQNSFSLNVNPWEYQDSLLHGNTFKGKRTRSKQLFEKENKHADVQVASTRAEHN